MTNWIDWPGGECPKCGGRMLRVSGYSCTSCTHDGVMSSAPTDAVEALRKVLPMLRRNYLQLAEKYAGTRFENDPAYLEAQADYENARAALAAADKEQG